ncbi:NAD(P)H-dependent glycerol-3-phosphate dehydrogenase [Clostridium arbusti]|uniref:NAD(P)H-dependent glycerol-3-phosphate dehydrogenase n=1 Tax=Clostridium arbusti TaxID=1137848 RepID=UPI000289BE00|nr:NAD(P)H-dependent glycerol-3-phosphate dehydrogenase [Clostridium arbusti]
MRSVTFLGGGSFGTALGILLANKGHKVTIWDRSQLVVNDINNNRTNDKYLSDIIIPDNVVATNSIEDSIEESDYVILSVPSFAIRDVCKLIHNKVNKNQIIVSIAKGIEEETKMRLSKVMKEELPSNPVVVLSGPSHAEEVSKNLPTTVVVSSESMDYAYRVQDLFMTNNFRVYTNDDIIGVEIGGAVKNIIALACGICDGLGYGDNTKAALMTRGMSEIVRVGTLLGGRRETFYGLTGMGDLIVTCTSLHSRNRRAGIFIGEGVPFKEACNRIGMVVEGVKACEAFYEWKDKLNVNMPITDMLYKVLFKNKDVKTAVKELMERDKKDEMH